MRLNQGRFSLVLWLILTVAAGLATGCRAQEPVGSSLREQFRTMLFSGRTPSELQPVLLSSTDVGTTKLEKVRFTPETGFDAVALIQRPKAEGKYPAVIVQHFLGGSKDHLVVTSLLGMLAQKGFVAAAIDGRYRGDRQKGTSLEAAMAEALRTGKGRPFLVDTVYDVTRLVDYLQTRPDVDGVRIGMTGLSEGGIITWMTAAADDRIRVAIPIIGVTSFADTLAAAEDSPDVRARIKLFDPILRDYAKQIGEKEPNARVLREAWAKLVPGMLDKFDAPAIVPLIAPRPLLILAHEQDEVFPVAGAKRVFDITKSRYAELKSEDRVDFKITPGLRHSIDGNNFAELSSLLMEANQTILWLERWLKTQPN